MANKIIKAEVQTNSADDNMGRVKLKSEGIWSQETELVQSVNGCALSKGDIVFVSVADGFYNPLILGKADRNDIVLNLLVDRINILEDKINDMLTALAQPSLVAEGAWTGSSVFGVPTGVGKITQKTKLKDIQDNYK